MNPFFKTYNKPLHWLFFWFIQIGMSNAIMGSDSISVYIFMLDDCPICQSYAPKLTYLYEEYGKEYNINMVFPNLSSKPDKISNFKEKFHITLPHKTDYFKSLAKKFDIKVTPEVVVYDHSSDTVVYKGRIDNEFEDLGRRRKIVTTNELEEVLVFLRKGENKIFPFTKAIGCFVEWNDMK